MGCDINGAIEVLEDPSGTQWTYVVDLYDCLDGLRSQDLFGCLFGVKNFANCHPLFPDRGLPEGLSFQIRQELQQLEPGPDSLHPTWCTFEELKQIDLDEPALKPDDRIHEFEIHDGEEILVSKASWSKRLEKEGVYDALSRAIAVRRGQRVYRRVVLRRREAMRGFEPVLEEMARLAETRKPQNIRIVVWFGE